MKLLSSAIAALSACLALANPFVGLGVPRPTLAGAVTTPITAPFIESKTGNPYGVLLTGTSANVIWDGPARIVGVEVLGNNSGGVVTVALADATGGNPTGGRSLGTLQIPSGAGPSRIQIDEPCIYGVIATPSSSTSVAIRVYIEGYNPTGNPFAVSDGSVIFRGDLTPASTTRVDTATVNTDMAYVREGTSSVKIMSANPSADVVAEWNQGTQTGVASIAPADQFQNIAVDLYVPSGAVGTNYNNGTNGGTGNIQLWVQLYDSGGTNAFNSTLYDVGVGWNRIVFPRNAFSTGAGSPSWASTTFTKIDLRFSVGTSTSPDLVVYVDAIRINVRNTSPIPVMLDGDDGWDFQQHLTTVLSNYPYLKWNEFLVPSFSNNTLSTYATGAEWKAFSDRYSGRVFVGWHSWSHTGPTAMEGYSVADFTAYEVTPWVTWFKSIFGSSSELHGVTPNGQNSANMRTVFAAQNFVTNRGTRTGVNHPFGIKNSPYDLKIFALSGSQSYPTYFNSRITDLQQTGCLGIFLDHQLSSEDSGTPISGAAASLNRTPIESDGTFSNLDRMCAAGLVQCLTRSDIKKYMTISATASRQ